MRSSGENSRKKNSYYYFLPGDNDRVALCKMYFLKTLGISDRMVRYAHEHKEIPGVSRQTGHREAHNATSESALSYVRSHIDSFPKVDGHYRRKQSEKDYLEQGLSLAKMYRLYTERCKQTDTEPVKECIYRKIFNTEYNLDFHLPTNDQSRMCTEYRVNTKEGTDEYTSHLRRKEQERTSKATDKVENGRIIAATFDLQQVLTAPKLNVGSAYYSRKLNVYNLCILDLQTHQWYGYM